MTKENNIIQKIKDKGMTKWRISKNVGVSWKTVHSWHKGFSKPNNEHLYKLEELLNSLL